jgi:hypothetical protein
MMHLSLRLSVCGQRGVDHARFSIYSSGKVWTDTDS